VLLAAVGGWVGVGRDSQPFRTIVGQYTLEALGSLAMHATIADSSNSAPLHS
jgi:hypothetical protein